MANYRLNIPTKRYLKKYLAKLFNEDFSLKKSDHHIKTFLFYLLQREAADKYKLDNPKFSCNDVVTFRVSMYTFQRYGFDLQKDRVIVFNDYLEDHFKEALHNFIRFRIACGAVKKKAIEEFADHYHITPDDIDYDSLRRMEHRYRQRYNVNTLYKHVANNFDQELTSLLPHRIINQSNKLPPQNSTLF